MPLIILFIIGAIILPIITAKNAQKPVPPAQPHVSEPGRVTLDELSRSQQSNAPAGQQQRMQQPQQKPQTVYQYMRDAVEQTASEDAERRRRQEELKRRLEANAQRRAQEKPMQKQDAKPVIAHDDDDCGGGSIHDGYHEGVSNPPIKNPARPVAVAGKLGQKLADEDDELVREQKIQNNAKRAMARIQKLPPMAQGMVFSEILGKPKSELG